MLNKTMSMLNRTIYVSDIDYVTERTLSKLAEFVQLYGRSTGCYPDGPVQT